MVRPCAEFQRAILFIKWIVLNVDGTVGFVDHRWILFGEEKASAMITCSTLASTYPFNDPIVSNLCFRSRCNLIISIGV